MDGREIEKNLEEKGLESYGRFYSIYRGFIESNEDPEFLGRLKLKVPQVWNEEVHDYWAWSKGMYSGTGIGMFAIPNIGDMVWVSFEGGDPSFPVWEYGHFAHPQGMTSDVPTDWQNNGNKPTMQVWQTSCGHRIMLDGKDGSEKITIQSKHSKKIVFDSSSIIVDNGSGRKITLNGTSIEIDNGGGKKFVIDGTSAILTHSVIKLGSATAVQPGILGGALNTMLTSIITALTAAQPVIAGINGTAGTAMSTAIAAASTAQGNILSTKIFLE